MALSYVLNRYFTFDEQRRGPFVRQVLAHFGVHAGGGLLNYGIFITIVAVGEGVVAEGLLRRLLPLLGLWLGGIVGMAFNFVLARRLVFPSVATATASRRTAPGRARTP